MSDVKNFPENLITDRSESDVAQKNSRGTYNASDLNRVASAAKTIHDMLHLLGYNSTPEIPAKTWEINEIPGVSALAAHHNAVIGQDVLHYAAKKHPLPESLQNLNYEGANNIERFLRDTYYAAKRIPEAYVYSGEVFGGEIN